MDAVIDAIVVTDEVGVIQSANAAVERIFGHRLQDVCGLNVGVLMPPEHAPRHDSYIERCRRTGERPAIGTGRALFGRRKDGSLFPAEASVAGWTADDGRRFFTGTVRDMTEHRAAAAALRDSQEWLRTVSDTALVGLLVVDRQRRVRFANRAFAMLNGLAPRDFTGCRLEEVSPDFCRPETLQHLDASFAGHRRTCRSLRGAQGDPAEARHLASTFELSQDASGAAVVVVVTTDVTDLARSEDELRASRDLLQSVLDGTLDPIFAKDRNGRYVAINDSAARIIGRERGDVIGRDDSELRTADVSEGLAIQDRRVMASGRTETFEFSTAVDRGPVHYVVTKRPWAGSDGTVRGTVGIAHDVTEQRSAAIERRDVAKRLHAAQEQERLRIARDLHDQVGQEVTALSLGLQALDAELLPAGRAKLAWLRGLTDRIGRDIHRTALQLRSTTLDDLGLKHAITSQATELAARLDLKVDLYLDEIDRRALHIDVQIALFRAVQECLTNVLKHAGPAAVSITARWDGDWLRILVEDDGCGFDPEAGQEPGGFGGLGLLGVRERLEAVGGTLAIESAPGRGTSVFLAVEARRAAGA